MLGLLGGSHSAQLQDWSVQDLGVGRWVVGMEKQPLSERQKPPQ